MYLSSATFLLSATHIAGCPAGEFPEIAFIGRSNVGKSTLINRLAKQKGLAKTSAKPGKTQLINYFTMISKDDEQKEHHWYLVDLPGYGFAKVSKTDRFAREDMIVAYLLERTSLTQICVLIDSSIPTQKIDLEFITWLQKHDKPFSIVFTKSDKVNQKTLQSHIQSFGNALSKIVPELPNFFITTDTQAESFNDVLVALHEIIQ